ncbi:VOC family protein [Chloroflexota bacterium]
MGTENWTLLHVGLSVRNTDEAVKYYESLGGKAAEMPDIVLSNTDFMSLRTYGKTDAPSWKLRIKMLNLGPLTLELLEPLEGDNFIKTWMDEHGEGANHIAYIVDNLEKEVAELEEKGVPVMYHAEARYAYMDTRETGGVVIELMQKGELLPPTG